MFETTSQRHYFIVIGSFGTKSEFEYRFHHFAICDPKSINHQHQNRILNNDTKRTSCTVNLRYSYFFAFQTMMFHSICLVLCLFTREALGFNVATTTRPTESCLYNSMQRTEAKNTGTDASSRRNVLESLLTASLLSTTIFTPSIASAADGVDYKAVAEDIASLVIKIPDWGPTLVRLAWHSSGTYDKMLNNGGSSGGTIRFKEELAHGGNAGLADTAVSWMDPIYAKYKDQGLSYADLYTLGGGKYYFIVISYDSRCMT
jgi:Peroxidase